MQTTSHHSTERLDRSFLAVAVAIIGLSGVLLFAIWSTLAETRTFSEDLSLTMRRINEVTWRVKSLETWTDRVHFESRMGPGRDLEKALIFATGEADALAALPYLNPLFDKVEREIITSLPAKLQGISDDFFKSGANSPDLSKVRSEIAILVGAVGNYNYAVVTDVFLPGDATIKQRLGSLVLAFVIGIISLIALVHANRVLAARRLAQDRAQLDLLRSLSSGFAHYTSNAVFTLRSRLDTLKRNSQLSEENKTAITQTLRDLDGLARLKTALARAVSEPEGFSEIGRLRDLTDHLAARFATARVEIITNVPPSEGDIAVRVNTLDLVLTELIRNAIKATEDSIAPQIDIFAKRAGESLTLSVSDNGCGMCPEVLSRCRTPLFSTQPDGDHMGLGLHFVERMVEEMNGKFTIISEQGEGTSMTIRIPEVQA